MPQLASGHRRRADQRDDTCGDDRARCADDERKDDGEEASYPGADEVGPIEHPGAGRVLRETGPDYRAREEERHRQGQVVKGQVRELAGLPKQSVRVEGQDVGHVQAAGGRDGE